MTATIDRETSVSVPDVPEKWRLGPLWIPKSRYLDPEFLQLECEKLFPATWVIACREEEVANVGEFVEFELAGESVLIVRDSPKTIKAFFNSCRHRATRLAHGRGRIGNFRCPFHAWQYALDGACQYVHDRQDFNGDGGCPMDDEFLRLRSCRMDTWAGFVFVNIDGTAAPLLDFLSPLPEKLEILALDKMRIRWQKTIVTECNWKIALDAFSESYHVPGTHPQLLRSGEGSTRPASRRELESDVSYAPSHVIGHNVSHFLIEPRNPETPRNATVQSLNDYLEYDIRELRGALHPDRHLEAARDMLGMDIPDGPDVITMWNKLVRERALAEGLDWPAIEHGVEGNYVIMPNLNLIARQGSLQGFYSRPNGSDPDSCISDIFALELYPEGKEPEPVRTMSEDWHDADLGGVLSQDWENIKDVTVGLHSRGFEGSRLNGLQELPVFHRQQVIDEYLFGR